LINKLEALEKKSGAFSLNKKNLYICSSLSLLYEMTHQQKKLWQLVTEKAGSNLEARMVYDELLKKINMSEERIILSMVETENGIEVHVGEQAYENFAVIGLIEKIKMDLLNRPELPIYDLRKKKGKEKSSQNYDA